MIPAPFPLTTCRQIDAQYFPFGSISTLFATLPSLPSLTALMLSNRAIVENDIALSIGSTTLLNTMELQVDFSSVSLDLSRLTSLFSLTIYDVTFIGTSGMASALNTVSNTSLQYLTLISSISNSAIISRFGNLLNVNLNFYGATTFALADLVTTNHTI